MNTEKRVLHHLPDSCSKLNNRYLSFGELDVMKNLIKKKWDRI